MIGRLRRAPPAVPVGLTEQARRFETGRRFVERAPRLGEVGGLEGQRLAERRISDGIFHSPKKYQVPRCLPIP